MKEQLKKYAALGFCGFLLYLCIHYWPAVSSGAMLVLSAAFPLLVGAVIAFIVNLPMAWFERHWFPKSKKKFVVKTRRVFSLVLAVVCILAIIALIVWLVLPQLIDCISLIIDLIPGAIEKVIAQVQSWNILPEDIFAALNKIDWESRIEQIITTLYSGVGNVVDVVVKLVTNVFSGIVTGFLSVIFALYLLMGKEKLQAQCNRLIDRFLSPAWQKRVRYGSGVFHESFHKFIVGQCTEAVVLGALCTLGMLIFRFPYATMIGALIAFTALIPVAGAFIGAGIGAFMILTVSPLQALLFLVYIVILQQLEGNIIYPRVVGSSLGLPGLWVLAAVTVGGGVGGVVGMLLGVPLMATLYRVLRDDLEKHEPKPIPVKEEKQIKPEIKQ